MHRLLYILISISIGLASCKRVTLVIDQVPSNTPQGSSIFMASNFNMWDPGDGNFQFTRQENGKYVMDLPLGFGKVQYKFTRGDWTTVEGDGCGHSINDRWTAVGNILYDWFAEDTVHHRIYSWEDLNPTDCEMVTFRLKKLPKNTPSADMAYLTGSFNDWRPDDPKYKFKKSPRGFYYIDLAKYDEAIEFKVTRGSWQTEETDNNGERIPNREFTFGAQDTVDLDVPGWVDIKAGMEERTVTFIVTTPGGTPMQDPLYIVGNFNSWRPGDPKFEMKKLFPNLFSITMKKPAGEMEYKFTRGPWGMEEVDVFGNHISNRRLRTSADTIRITVPEWADIPVDQTFSFKKDEINHMMNNPDLITFPIKPGERVVQFYVTNHFKQTTTLYVRIVLPSAPGNRNYGLSDEVKPGKRYKLHCPEGARFIACDGPFWNQNQPKEKPIFTVSADMHEKTFDAELFVMPNTKPLPPPKPSVNH